jgi:hypothetical protein
MKRTIIAEGDAQHVVTRVAKKYRASVRVRTESGEELSLIVGPTGEWTLYQRGGAFEQAFLLTCGRLK